RGVRRAPGRDHEFRPAAERCEEALPEIRRRPRAIARSFERTDRTGLLGVRYFARKLAEISQPRPMPARADEQRTCSSRPVGAPTRRIEVGNIGVAGSNRGRARRGARTLAYQPD